MGLGPGFRLCKCWHEHAKLVGLLAVISTQARDVVMWAMQAASASALNHNLEQHTSGQKCPIIFARVCASYRACMNTSGWNRGSLLNIPSIHHETWNVKLHNKPTQNESASPSWNGSISEHYSISSESQLLTITSISSSEYLRSQNPPLVCIILPLTHCPTCVDICYFCAPSRLAVGLGRLYATQRWNIAILLYHTYS